MRVCKTSFCWKSTAKHVLFSSEISCSQLVFCAMRPPSSFRSCAKRRWSAPGPEEKGAKRGQHRTKREAVRADIERCAYLVQKPCRIASPSAALPGSQTASRGKGRGEIPVRSTMERQRYPGAPPTPHCLSGDPGFSLGFPAFARSPEDTSSGRLSLEYKNRFFPRWERNGS